ncbi:MAG: AsmA family protein [PVC group bacterium]
MMKEKKGSFGKKIIAGVVIVIVLLLGAGAAGVLYLNYYVNTPEFLEKIRSEAQKQSGVDLKLGSLSASIFKGFVVTGIVVSSPVEGDPPVLTVDEVTLKYNLGDLLGKKVTIDRIIINSPLIRLKRDAEGKWIIPGAPKQKEEASSRGKKKPEPEPAPVKKESSWKISIESLQVRDGAAELVTGKGYDPVKIEEVNLTARVLQLTEPRQIEGQLTVGGISFKGDRLVSDLRADLQLQGEREMKAKVEASVADGTATGTAGADLKNHETIPYHAELTLKKIDIPLLIKPFRGDELKMEITGKMFGSFTARGDVQKSDALAAEGDLDIKDGSITGNPIQELVARLMNDDEHIKVIAFDQADAEFNLARQVVTLTRVIIRSYKVIFTVGGTIDLEHDQKTDLLVGLNFSDDLVGDIKPKELRGAFTPAADFQGYQVFTFKVWGPPDNLQNDFAARFIQGGASSWLKDELLKKDRNKEEDPNLTDEERVKKQDKREKKEQAIDQGVNTIFKLFDK